MYIPEKNSESATVQVETGLGLTFRSLPGDFITFLLQRDNLFESPETDLVTRLLRPGDICVDAGCHIGYYTCITARLVAPRGHVYAFDANPAACRLTEANLALNNLQSAEVIHGVLGDGRGTTAFHISSDDQTGLSSLGSIPACKQTIFAPWLRLEDFFKERKLKSVRLLKIDVEGAEEMVLRGLGHFLHDQVVDFILMESYDERLKLLNTSTEKLAFLLQDAGYTAWEYGVAYPGGWSPAEKVVSRGDCNYVFASSKADELMPRMSVVSALARTQNSRNDFEKTTIELAHQIESQRQQIESQHQQLELQVQESLRLKQHIERLEHDLDSLLDELSVYQQKLMSAEEMEAHLRSILRSVENSIGWRFLNLFRRMRDGIAPKGTRRREMYNRILHSGE